jgi:sulfite reductase alpha subunit-like flavoprotein
MRLSQCCTDPREAALLQHICSKGDIGKKLWRHFVELQGIGAGELLALFPSCTPSLDQLVGACTVMPPRCYSIASSPLRDPDAVRIAFSVVKYTCSLELTAESVNIIRRRGVCTTYLENLLEPFLRSVDVKSDKSSLVSIKIRLFHKPSINFKLPGSTSYPLILIGPGTGVAPFIGFLEQRQAIEKERLFVTQSVADSDATTAATKQRTVSGSSNSHIKFGAKECCMGEWRGGIEMDDLPIEGSSVDNYLNSVPPGDIWLFFGCRNTQDFLFQVIVYHTLFFC